MMHDTRSIGVSGKYSMYPCPGRATLSYMEEADIAKRMAVLETKIDEVHKYVKRLYNIFLWTGIITVAMFVLPLIGLMFVIPSFISSYTSMGSIGDPSSQSATQSLDQVNGLAKQLQGLIQ